MRKFLSVLLAVMMVLSTVSFAAPMAVGTVDTGAEVAAVPEVYAKEAELSAESEYGTLLFDIDFEGEAFVNGEIGSGAAVQAYSSVTQPELPENFEGYFELVGNTMESTTLDTDNYDINGTNVLRVHGDSDPSWPYVAVQAVAAAGNWSEYPGFPDGTYTIVVDAVYDYNNSAPGIIQARFADTGSFGGGDGLGAQQALRNGAEFENPPYTDSFVVTWDVLNQEDGSTKVTAANGAEKTYATVKSMGLYFGQMGNNPDYIYVDNFKMYFKPNTVNVTINNNGVLVKTMTVSTKGVLVSDLVKEAGISADYSITEIKVNGEKVLLADTVTFGADSVVDITSEKLDLSAYEDAVKGKMLFNITFEDYELDTVLTSQYSADNGSIMLTDSSKTPYADAIMSHDLKVWGIFGQGATYSIMEDPNNPDNTVVGALNVTSTGYPQFRIDTFRDSQERTGDRADVAWGFVEEDGSVLTLEYDFMDENANLATTDRFAGQSSVLGDDGNPKWTEREDTPDEHLGEIVSGEYRTNTSVYSDAKRVNVGSTAEVSCIKIHAKQPTANSYYIDNVKLWYKPGKADITVKSVGAPLDDIVLNDVKTTGITSAELLALIDTSSIDSSKYVVKGISFDEEGAKLVSEAVFAGDTTLYLIWQEVDMSAYTDENGILLYDISFDNLAEGTPIANRDLISTFATKLNPNFAGSDAWYINLSGYTDAVVENGALKATKTAGSGRWPQIQISAGEGKSIVSDGVIYATADLKLGLDASQTATVTLGLTSYVRKWNGTKWEGTTNDQNSFGQIVTPVNNTWYTLSNTAVLEGKEYNGVECIIFLPSYSAASTLADNFYLDNLKLYYRPYNVNVTLVSDDSNLTLPEPFKVPTTGIAVSELVKNVKSSSVYYKVTGVKVDGEEYGLSDTVVLTKDCEVEVLAKEDTEYVENWISNEHGILLFKTDFDSAAVGSIKITGSDNEDAAAFTATSEVNPYFSEYSSMVGTMLLGDAYAPENAEIVYDEVLESNVLKFTASQSYTGLMYTTPYNQRNKCDLINSPTGVLTIVHKLKAPVGATYRYNGFINNYPGTLTYNTGGDDSQDSYYSTDLGNGYSELVAVYNMVDGFHIDSFKIHLAGATAGDVAYFDDIEVYWKPATVDVTVKNIGVALDDTVLENVTTAGVTAGELASLIDTSSINTTQYVVKGISLKADGSDLVDKTYFVGDTTVYLVWEKVDMSEYIDENGILLFEVDFDKLSKGTAVADGEKLSTLGRVNPFYAKSSEYAIQLSTFTNGRVTDFDNDGNNELAFDKGTSGQYPQILFGLIQNNVSNALTGGGTYYATASYYIPAGYSDLRSYSITNNGIKGGVHQGPSGLMEYNSLYTSNANFKFGQWCTMSGAKNTKDAGIDDINKITNLFTMTSGTEAGTFYLDNIKLYWRPHTVKVTIDSGDNTTVDNVTFDMKTTGVAVEEVMSNMFDWGSKKLVGLSLTEGGEALAAGTLLSPCEDVTYYAVWDDFGTLLEGYGADFNGVETYNEIKWETYGTGSDTGAMYNYAAAAYTEGDTSYMSVKSIPVETANGVIDSQLRLEQALPAGALKGVAVRMRVTGFPNEDYTVTAGERTEEAKANALGILKVYYKIKDLGLSESRTFSATRDWTTGLFDGKWMTLYFDLSSKTDIATTDLEFLRIDLADEFPKDATVDFDYIHFYGDAADVADKPVTDNAIAIRTGADSKNGMRFKATMSGAANAQASDYGWVIVDSSKVNTHAITRSSDSSVKTYYAREAGVDKVDFFDATNDNALVFAATVYNIKPEYAKKTLIIRPFIIVDGIEYYGAPVTKSIYSLACQIRDGGYAGVSDEDKTFIEQTIAAADALEA